MADGTDQVGIGARTTANCADSASAGVGTPLRDMTTSLSDHPRPPHVAYVMTHHPRTALTFIALEIQELERVGGRVTPIAVNLPDPADVESDDARHAARRTTYLKAQGAVRLASSLLRTWLRHPAEMAALTWLAITSARLDLPLAARRLVHLAYACWSWRAVADRGVRHFHAHFGQTPATVAWFAAAVGSFSSGERCTWSFTIHGFQDFADERVTRLDLKVRSASFVVVRQRLHPSPALSRDRSREHGTASTSFDAASTSMPSRFDRHHGLGIEHAS